MNDQLLENVSVELESLSDSEEWKVCKTIPLDSLSYSAVGTTYTLLEMPESGAVTGSFGATLKFKARDVDPSTGQPDGDECYDETFVVSYLMF